MFIHQNGPYLHIRTWLALMFNDTVTPECPTISDTSALKENLSSDFYFTFGNTNQTLSGFNN